MDLRLRGPNTFEPDAREHTHALVGAGTTQGAYKLLGLLITWIGMRQEQRIWLSLKKHLEAAH